MPSFCKLDDLVTESDVEQKFIWGLLTEEPPIGLGYNPSDIKTKNDIRRFEIGKGAERKLYYPDYVAVMNGLPMFIVEAKAPEEDLAQAQREARLYALELNSRFPAFQNPCGFTLISNGNHTSLLPWDSDEPIASFAFSDCDPSNINFSKVCEKLKKKAISLLAQSHLTKLAREEFFRPINLAGGVSVRNEEIAPNNFGTSFVLNFRHIFNPASREDRSNIVRNAYIPSRRRERYIQSIDRVIRAAAPPSVSDAKSIEDTSRPAELTSIFGSWKKLEHQVLLLIGAVGAGKSTFVDYLQEVALPPSIKSTTVWVHVDLNVAPLSREVIYSWTADKLREKLPAAAGNVDVESLTGLEKLFAPDLQRLRKGALSLLDPTSMEYKTRLADELLRLQNDGIKTVQALERFLCTERNKLLVVVLDNCDKRGRDEQLLMFQVAQWLQATFRCLVVLPLRDVTYDNHRHEPPLDTALKDLVYRIEPPNFQRVLHARVLLAFKEMQKEQGNQLLSYTLANGIRVEYPSSQLGMFLASIMRSIYEHDAFIRRMITGLAGRDIRRALEIFLEFCTSGHIDEAEILKITTSKGQYCLPYYVVANVLFRMNRRYYDGDQSYVRNIFQCNPHDIRPDHRTRLMALFWLRSKMALRGPNGVRGYHKTESLISYLTSKGISSERALEEVLYLVKAMCIIPEHQLQDRVSLEDLITISPAGYVHLDLLDDVNYLAACAEDLWFADKLLATEIQTRIAHWKSHFTRLTTLLNAKAMLTYIRTAVSKVSPDTALFLEGDKLQMDDWFAETEGYVDQSLSRMS